MTSGTRSVGVDAVINLPVAQAWQRLRDFSLAPYYVPGLTGVTFTTANTAGVGASRQVHMKNGSYLDETVVDWQEGRSFTIRVHRGEKSMMPLFKEALFQYALEDAGSGRTRFCPKLSYTPAFGPLGWLFFATVGDWILALNLKKVAANLKQFYETGKSVNPDFPGG